MNHDQLFRRRAAIFGIAFLLMGANAVLAAIDGKTLTPIVKSSAKKPQRINGRVRTRQPMSNKSSGESVVTRPWILRPTPALLDKK